MFFWFCCIHGLIDQQEIQVVKQMPRPRTHSSPPAFNRSNSANSFTRNKKLRLRKQLTSAFKFKKSTAKITRRNARNLRVIPADILAGASGDIISLNGRNGQYQAYFLTSSGSPTMVVNFESRINAATKAEVQSDLQQMLDSAPDIFANGQVLPGKLVLQIPSISADIVLAHELASSLLSNAIINNPSSDADLLGIADFTQTESGGLSTLAFRIGETGSSAAIDAQVIANVRDSVASVNRIQDANAGGISNDLNNASSSSESSGKNLFARFAQYKQRRRDKRLAVPLQNLNTQTINDVFRAETTGSIGKQGTRIGYAKRAVKKGQQNNATTDYIGIQADNNNRLLVNPNLIARQVLSYRLDKHIGLDVTAVEIFSEDTDGNIIGITAEAVGTQAMETSQDGRQILNRFDLDAPQAQKSLSDLQLMDAITGQLDRHLGNLFIDKDSGKVTGIDNDGSFPTTNSDMVNPTGNILRSQFERQGGTLVYKQLLVDSDSAEKILEIDEGSFRKVLQGRSRDPEKLDNASINAAVERLRAVQHQVQRLRNDGKLIDSWGDSTFVTALDTGFNSKNQPTNYLSRAVAEYDRAGDPTIPSLVQMP